MGILEKKLQAIIIRFIGFRVEAAVCPGDHQDIL